MCGGRGSGGSHEALAMKRVEDRRKRCVAIVAGAAKDEKNAQTQAKINLAERWHTEPAANIAHM